MSSAPHGVAFAPIAAMMFATGIGIPLMATINAQLGRQLDSAPAATAILFCVGGALACVIVLVTGPPAAARFATVPWPYYCGALFMLFYLLAVTWSAPRIGVGNAVFFVLLGQMAAAAAIDHFGLWGALQTAITPRRVAGLAIMAFGIYLARRPV